MQSMKKNTNVWVSIWVAVCAVLGSAVALAGPPDLTFEGGPNFLEGSQGSVKTGQYSFTVVDVARSLSDTEVQLEVQGLGTDGRTLEFQGIARLTDEQGNRAFEKGGHIEGRVLTLQFYSSELRGGAYQLEVPGISLAATPDAPVVQLGNFRLKVEIPTAAPTSVYRIDSGVAWRSGNITAGNLLTDGQDVLVSGKLQAFTIQEIAEVSFEGAVLRSATGARFQIAEARTGFGSESANFELRFKGAEDFDGSLVWVLELPEAGMFPAASLPLQLLAP